MELLADIVKGRNPFTIFARVYILDIWQGDECAFEEVGDLLNLATHDFQGESTLYSLLEGQRTPCSKHPPYLEFKWLQLDSKPQPLSL